MAKLYLYEERVAEVINEELCRVNVSRRDLPEYVQDALNRIEIRLAADLEDLYKKTPEGDEDRKISNALMIRRALRREG